MYQVLPPKLMHYQFYKNAPAGEAKNCLLLFSSYAKTTAEFIQDAVILCNPIVVAATGLKHRLAPPPLTSRSGRVNPSHVLEKKLAATGLNPPR